MLISFSIGNFLSFKDIFTLSLEPDALKERQEYLHIPYMYDPSLRLLKSLSLYGHNSHGKSNLVKAFVMFQDFVLTSANPTKSEKIDIERFRLNSSSLNIPTHFEVKFYVREKRFRYGFKVTSEKVVEEWLYYAESKIRENYLFERVGQETKISKLWKKEFSNIIEKSVHFTQSHQLLLSSLMSAKIVPNPIDGIAAWVKGNMIFTDISEDKHLKYALLILSLPEYRPLINRLISAADLGFTTIIDKIDRLSREKLVENAEMLNILYQNELRDFTLYSQHGFYDENHKLIENITFEFLKSESSGTVRFLLLACFLVFAIKKGQLIIVDEMDSKFHSALFEVIVHFFNNPKINVQGSQLIFTTHNTVLLDEVLRRDQIIVIDKNEFGESTLRKAHSPSNPMRIGSPIERDFRKGKFGGVSKKIKKTDSQGEFNFE